MSRIFRMCANLSVELCGYRFCVGFCLLGSDETGVISFLLHHPKAIYGQSVAVMELEQQAN